jgi:hypothetical protein
MKKIILLLSVCLIAFASYAQTKTSKELKQDQNKAEMELAALSVDRMIADHQFILEVTFMSDQSRAFSQSAGMTDTRSQNNYIAIDSNKIMVQVEPNTYLATNWGFQNLPLRGNISTYTSSKSEKSDEGYFIRFRTSGQIGELSASMTVSAVGNTELKISKIDGETLTFRGVIKPLD